MTELEFLKAALEEDYYDLSGEGDKIDFDGGEGEFETVSVEEGDARRWAQWIAIVTKTPSGKFYSWGYDRGLTEMQDNEDFDGELTEVFQNIRTVVVVEYSTTKK